MQNLLQKYICFIYEALWFYFVVYIHKLLKRFSKLKMNSVAADK